MTAAGVWNLGLDKERMELSSVSSLLCRGYPDVSALAGQVNPYCIAYGGK